MSERPIFIVGCPRSGTTLLQLMVHAHPRIAIPPETRILVHGHRRRARFGDQRKPANRRAFAEWIVDGPRTQFADLGVSAPEFLRRAEEGPGSVGSVIGLCYQMFAERHGKPRWGDKRPPYIRHLQVIHSLFPDAQIVHLIRDGRDCVASLKEMPWFKGDVAAAVHRWAEAIDAGRAQRLPDGCYYELRYEDLTADPQGALSGLCTFLGEDYDPAMREPYQVAHIVPRHKDWHLNTRQAITTTRVASWRTRLTPQEISLCESVLGERLTAYGYELSGAAPVSRAELAHYRRTAAFFKRRARKWAFSERVTRLREPGPVAALSLLEV